MHDFFLELFSIRTLLGAATSTFLSSSLLEQPHDRIIAKGTEAYSQAFYPLQQHLQGTKARWHISPDLATPLATLMVGFQVLRLSDHQPPDHTRGANSNTTRVFTATQSSCYSPSKPEAYLENSVVFWLVAWCDVKRCVLW